MDGGRILKSVKTSYQEYVGSERMADIVRDMMKQQHKAMFIALRDGKFDQLAEGKQAPAAEPSRPSDSKKGKTGAPPKKSVTPTRVAPVPLMTDRIRSDDEPFEPEPRTVRDAEALTLDIDALERAAAVAESTGGSFKHANDLPPPPTNLFR